jgi:hypothetical protein
MAATKCFRSNGTSAPSADAGEAMAAASSATRRESRAGTRRRRMRAVACGSQVAVCLMALLRSPKNPTDTRGNCPPRQRRRAAGFTCGCQASGRSRVRAAWLLAVGNARVRALLFPSERRRLGRAGSRCRVGRHAAALPQRAASRRNQLRRGACSSTEGGATSRSSQRGQAPAFTPCERLGEPRPRRCICLIAIARLRSCGPRAALLLIVQGSSRPVAGLGVAVTRKGVVRRAGRRCSSCMESSSVTGEGDVTSRLRGVGSPASRAVSDGVRWSS